MSSNENNFKEFSKKTLSQFEHLLKDDIKGFNDKINDVKIENGKYNLELMKKNKEMKEKIEEIERVKESLGQFWEDEMEKIKKFHFVKFEDLNHSIHELNEKLKMASHALNVRNYLIL